MLESSVQATEGEDINGLALQHQLAIQDDHGCNAGMKVTELKN